MASTSRRSQTISPFFPGLSTLFNDHRPVERRYVPKSLGRLAVHRLGAVRDAQLAIPAVPGHWWRSRRGAFPNLFIFVFEKVDVLRFYIFFYDFWFRFTQGGGSYNAGGMSTYISSPHMDFAGIKSNAILGELVGLGGGCVCACAWSAVCVSVYVYACMWTTKHIPNPLSSFTTTYHLRTYTRIGGFMVFLFSPLSQCGALEYFGGRGGSIFVGGGAALLGYSPLFHAVALHNEHAHWWISVRV